MRQTLQPLRECAGGRRRAIINKDTGTRRGGRELTKYHHCLDRATVPARTAAPLRQGRLKPLTPVLHGNILSAIQDRVQQPAVTQN